MAITHDLYKISRNIDVFTESELLQVKVPIVFLVTRFSRDPGTDITLLIKFHRPNALPSTVLQ